MTGDSAPAAPRVLGLERFLPPGYTLDDVITGRWMHPTDAATAAQRHADKRVEAIADARVSEAKRLRDEGLID